MSSSKPTLVSTLARSITRYGSEPLFGTKRSGAWSWTSYREFGQMVDRLRAGLASLGVERGDSVVLISNNRVEWAVTAYASYGLGAALVPMYEAQSEKDWRFIVEDCAAKLLVCSTREIYDRCAQLPEHVRSLKQRLCMALPSSHAGSLARVMEAGEADPVDAIDPDPDDTAAIIYTSGTTGDPKGVVLSHHNICSNVASVLATLPLSHDDRSVSFLPWAASFGQTCELHALIHLGGSMALCKSTDKLMQDLADVKPTVLVSVPRIFNSLYEAVAGDMESKAPLIRKLLDTGLELGRKRQRGAKLNMAERIGLEAADRMVLSQVRARFGGRLKCAFSGGAALSPEVAELIDAVGITVYEGYGLTEAGPVVSANRPGAHRIGSVGKPIEGVRVEIDTTVTSEDDVGEIVVYSPGVMRGYLGKDAETKRALTEDGGLRTGDVGRFDDDGFLYITGRLEEQYKLANGKYVFPALLEEQIALSSHIKSVMVHGNGREYNVALVVVDVDTLHEWASEHELSFDDTAAMLDSARVKGLIMGEINKRSREFRAYERVKRIALIAEDFTPHNDMLTPTLKLKRRAVMAQYRDRIERLYAE